MSAEILGPFSVEESKRVECQYPKEHGICGYKVYAEIYVCCTGGDSFLLGSSCLKKLIQKNKTVSIKRMSPSGESYRSTPEELDQIKNNTKLFLEKIRIIVENEKSKDIVLNKKLSFDVFNKSLFDRGGKIKAGPALIEKAKAAVYEKHGVNPELPGWIGLVAYEVGSLIKKTMEKEDGK